MHPSQGGIRGGGGGGRGRGRGRGSIGRDRDLIGQTIKITQGPYKSHIGIVKVSKLLCRSSHSCSDHLELALMVIIWDFHLIKHNM